MAKIMLIDDEAETLEIHESFLQDEHTVYPYNSGVKAIDDIHKVNPDLILLDIEMPFMDGFQVLEKLQEIDGFSKVPVIGVTGQNSKASVLKFIGMGGSGYIAKPVGKQTMLTKVNEMLEKASDMASRYKILIVDDEIESLSLTKSMLETKYDVMALNSSKIALEYLAKITPDLIVLDYHMPLYDGRALFQMIRKIDKLKNTPVMYLTGDEPQSIMAESSSLPDAIIKKGGGKEALIEKIDDLLSKRKRV